MARAFGTQRARHACLAATKQLSAADGDKIKGSKISLWRWRSPHRSA